MGNGWERSGPQSDRGSGVEGLAERRKVCRGLHRQAGVRRKGERQLRGRSAPRNPLVSCKDFEARYRSRSGTGLRSNDLVGLNAISTIGFVHWPCNFSYRLLRKTGCCRVRLRRQSAVDTG